MEPQKITAPTRVNPYTVPPDQQGWRGLSLDGVNAKRRTYTVLWNEQVLVMALLTFPGERSVRHSHESGELTVNFSDALHPTVGYTPGGLIHAGQAPAGPEKSGLEAEIMAAATTPLLRDLLERFLEEQRSLRRAVDEMQARTPGPHIALDILFPPFKTTIDDPAYPESRTIIGPWFD
jgi:hypothetical protein